MVLVWIIYICAKFEFTIVNISGTCFLQTQKPNERILTIIKLNRVSLEGTNSKTNNWVIVWGQERHLKYYWEKFISTSLFMIQWVGWQLPAV